MPRLSKINSLDMGRFSPVWFQVYLLGFSVFLNFAVYSFFPRLGLGFFLSWGIQLFWLEVRYWTYFFARGQSGIFQNLFFLLSFFTNLFFLWMFSREQGSNFILGFFLAYFSFLGIFVLAGIFSQKDRTRIQ